MKLLFKSEYVDSTLWRGQGICFNEAGLPSMNQSTIQSFNKPKIHVDKFHPIEKEGCFVSLYLGLSHLRAHIYEFQCHRPQPYDCPKCRGASMGGSKIWFWSRFYLRRFFPPGFVRIVSIEAAFLFANQRRLRPRHMERRSDKSGSVQFQFIGSNK